MKYRRIYIATLGFVLVAHIQAAQLSEHNEQHAALQAAANRLYDAGCLRVEWPRTQRFGLHTTAEPHVYSVTGNALTVRCAKWPEPPVTPVPVLIDHLITWQRPTTRMDGKPLPPDQISGYMLEIDGVATFIGNVLSYTATYSVVMIHTYRIATVDTAVRQGPWSEEVKL